MKKCSERANHKNLNKHLLIVHNITGAKKRIAMVNEVRKNEKIISNRIP